MAKRRLVWMEMNHNVIPNLREMIKKEQLAKGWTEAEAKRHFHRLD